MRKMSCEEEEEEEEKKILFYLTQMNDNYGNLQHQQ